jgi:hypothetical protein
MMMPMLVLLVLVLMLVLTIVALTTVHPNRASAQPRGGGEGASHIAGADTGGETV